MIVFELICDQHHRFEGWFASPGEFDAQHGNKLLSCPTCDSTTVDKLPIAKIGRLADEPHALPDHRVSAPQVPDSHGGLALAELIDRILLNTEDVGREFAEEARRMHFDRAQRRGIRGQATVDEAEELQEEGIPVFTLPIPPKNDWN